MKIKINSSELCQDMPVEFSRYLDLVKTLKFKDIYMHRLINKTSDGLFTDHINHNKLDNRRENLRTVTNSQNIMNSKLRIDNMSGHKGIWFDKSRQKWTVEIMINQKRIHLGRYIELKEALKIRKDGEIKYHKEYSLAST